MAAKLIPFAANANPDTEQACGASGTAVRAIAAVMQKARAMWRGSAPAEMAVRTKRKVRAAEYWFSQNEATRRDMDRDSLIHLLQSDDGLIFLEQIILSMPKSERPRWWRSFVTAVKRADIRHRQKELQRQLDELDELSPDL